MLKWLILGIVLLYSCNTKESEYSKNKNSENNEDFTRDSLAMLERDIQYKINEYKLLLNSIQEYYFAEPECFENIFIRFTFYTQFESNFVIMVKNIHQPLIYIKRMDYKFDSFFITDTTKIGYRKTERNLNQKEWDSLITLINKIQLWEINMAPMIDGNHWIIEYNKNLKDYKIKDQFIHLREEELEQFAEYLFNLAGIMYFWEKYND